MIQTYRKGLMDIRYIYIYIYPSYRMELLSGDRRVTVWDEKNMFQIIYLDQKNPTGSWLRKGNGTNRLCQGNLGQMHDAEPQLSCFFFPSSLLDGSGSSVWLMSLFRGWLKHHKKWANHGKTRGQLSNESGLYPSLPNTSVSGIFWRVQICVPPHVWCLEAPQNEPR